MIALYLSGNNVIYFDGFVAEHFPNKIKNVIGNKNIITNIYRIKAYNLIIYGYFRIRFIDFMLKCKSLLHYKNLFSPKAYEKNDKIILKIFK